MWIGASGIVNICRLASVAKKSARAATANPAAARSRGRIGSRARQTRTAASASTNIQPATAPARPGSAYIIRLTATPQIAGPTTSPCASATRSSVSRSATRTTT